MSGAAAPRGPDGRRFKRKTLAVFVQAVIGSPVVVELRDDGIVRGTLAHADDALNLALTDATWTPLQGPPHPPALYLHLRSSIVRFVHLPASINPRTVVDEAERRAAAARAAARRAALAAEGRAGRQEKGVDTAVAGVGTRVAAVGGGSEDEAGEERRQEEEGWAEQDEEEEEEEGEGEEEEGG